jgi:hypothetical protein
VVLETSAGKKTFVIEDPKKIVATGRTDSAAKLSCGPQKPVQIRVDYNPPSTDNSDGTVRTIHFDP